MAVGYWVYPGLPPSGVHLPGGSTACRRWRILGWVGALRSAWPRCASQDDRGLALVERGLDHLSPKRQTGCPRTLALFGFIQLLLIFDIVCVSIAGIYSSPYPRWPDYVVNQMCDGPRRHRY